MNEDSWLAVFHLTDNTGDRSENNWRFRFQACCFLCVSAQPSKVERTYCMSGWQPLCLIEKMAHHSLFLTMMVPPRIVYPYALLCATGSLVLSKVPHILWELQTALHLDIAPGGACWNLKVWKTCTSKLSVLDPELRTQKRFKAFR